MERLNDIIGQAAQRRHLSDPRGPQGTAYQDVGTDVPRLSVESDVPRPSSPGQRRPLPEQNARLGRPIGTDAPRPSNVPRPSVGTDLSRPSDAPHPSSLGQKKLYGSQRHTHSTRGDDDNHRGLSLRGGQREPAVPREELVYNYPPAHQSPRRASTGYPRPRTPVNGTAPYQQDERQAEEEAYQPYRQPMLPANSLTPRTGHPYRPRQNDHTDDYVPAIAADVVDEWDDEDGGMVYGDWEKDEEEARIHRRTPMEVVTEPQNQRRRGEPFRDGRGEPRPYSQRTVREVAYPAEVEGRARVTRNLRDLRMPVAAPPPPAIPAPLAQPVPVRMQEGHQRFTRPLDPQAVANMDQERQHVEVRFTTHAARPALNAPPQIRQLVPQEQVQPVLSAPPLKQKNVCPKCKGAGYLRADVPFGHPSFGKPITCECKEAEQREKRRQQLRTMSNLDGIRSNSFRTFNPRVPGVQEAYQEAEAYAQNPDGWLLLVGPNGCGKTHLAAAIANECLEHGSVVLFAVVPDLLLHLRAAFAPNAAELYDQLFYKMREAEVLVLDDLGTQQSSPWANETLFQLLNYRYNMGMPTVITANPKGLQGTDERIRSRLSDNSLVTLVTFERARDYRPNHPRHTP